MRLLVFFCILIGSIPTRGDVPLCGKIVFSRPITPALGPIERRLVCGDPQASEAWRAVPLSQARFHLKTFLQARGYQRVEFAQNADSLKVIIDDPTKISQVHLAPESKIVDVTRRRNLIGSTLTPDNLNNVEAWVRGQYASRGYPCAQIGSRASALTGEVVVDAEPGAVQNFGQVAERPSLLREGTLSRYRAFRPDQLFDERLLTLTSRRAMNEGVVQSLTLMPQCSVNAFSLTQSAVLGPPRLFSFGFGFNTEEYFIVRATWTHSRLGRMASPLDVSATASLRTQKLETNWKWYVLDTPSRFYLRPSFLVERDDEPKYKTVRVNLRFLPSYDWDFEDFFISLAAGPSLEQTQTIEGSGPPLSQMLFLETQTELISHGFEYYRSEPQQGTHLLLKTAHVAADNVSAAGATQFLFSGEWLGNYGHYDPPLLVLGVRFGLESTLAESRQQVVNLLPSQFRYFLGGLADLRGFNRQELPFYGTGALTAAYAGFEARATGILPQNIQPYAFVDAGKVGDQSLSFNQELYWSPGLGLRWSSPIGVFRVSAAHGYVAEREPRTPEGLSHWQFYLAYGEEF